MQWFELSFWKILEISMSVVACCRCQLFREKGMDSGGADIASHEAPEEQV